jgi:orotidine-5'-phosphate decarboxylase
MCRSLKVLCAATGRERLTELKLATVSANWELVGGVASASELPAELDQWRPEVIVIEPGLGSDVVAMIRSRLAGARVVAAGGPVPGADEVATSLEEIREAVLGLPRPGGPVRA